MNTLSAAVLVQSNISGLTKSTQGLMFSSWATNKVILSCLPMHYLLGTFNELTNFFLGWFFHFCPSLLWSLPSLFLFTIWLTTTGKFRGRLNFLYSQFGWKLWSFKCFNSNSFQKIYIILNWFTWSNFYGCLLKRIF